MEEKTNTSMIIDEVIELISIIYGAEESDSNTTITKSEAKRKLKPLRELKRKGEFTSTLFSVDIPPHFMERLVENCPSLRELDLSQTSCSDLIPLSELRSLQSLRLDNTLVQDLSPLKEAEWLH